MRPYPPLATLYAASYLRNVGYSVALFDAMLAEGEHEFEAMLDAHPRAALCGFVRRQLQFPEQDVPDRMREAACTWSAWPARGACLSSSAVPMSPITRRSISRDGATHGGEATTPGAQGDHRRGPRTARPLSGGRAKPASLLRRFPAWFCPTRRRRRFAAHGQARAGAQARLFPFAGLGFARRRALPRGLDGGARLLQPEHGHHARLPVPLQLVRQADLGSALRHALAGQRGRGDGLDQARPATRSHLVRRRHLWPAPAMGGRALAARWPRATPPSPS